MLPQVAVQFGHEALAESHDLIVGLAFGVEVGSAFSAADRHAGQGVLEDLLEAQELDDAEVDGGVETKAPLVGAERTVELDAEAAVDLDLALVVLPGYPEDDLALRLADALDDLAVRELGVLGQHRSQAVEYFQNGLVELGLPRIASEDLLIDTLNLFVHAHASNPL